MLLVWKLFALNRHSGTLPHIDKVSISPSRCRDHRQNSDMDWRSLTVVYRTCCFFSPRGKIAWSRTFPSVSARTLESAVFPGFFTD